MIFKKITVITRKENLMPLREALVNIGVDGMTVTPVEGSGVQNGVITYVEDGKPKLHLLPKVKIEMMVACSLEDNIINVVKGICHTGRVGDGKVFVEKEKGMVLKIRTNDENEQAL